MSDERFPQRVRNVDARENLRAVGRNLYVGGLTAICVRPAPTREWYAAIDCHGYRETGDRERCFGLAPRVIRYGFHDGDRVPVSLLDAALGYYLDALGHGPLLVTCAAGVSRSASVAYALLRVVGGLTHAEALVRVEIVEEHYDRTSTARPRSETLESARVWADGRVLDAAALRAARVT